jgi:hypothetical protein
VRLRSDRCDWDYILYSTESIMLAHGFAIGVLRDLVHNGLATAQRRTVRTGRSVGHRGVDDAARVGDPASASVQSIANRAGRRRSRSHP